MKNRDKATPYGSIQTPEEAGALARAHRKRNQLRLEDVSGIGNLGVRFLSEFERGKPTAEFGKVLKALQVLGLEVIIQPRSAPSVSRRDEEPRGDR